MVRVVSFWLLACLALAVQAAPLSGLDVLIRSNFSQLSSAGRVGYISNPTGVSLVKDGPHLLQHGVDIMHFHSSVDLVAIFGPEHGFRGAAPPGSGGRPYYLDNRTGLPVYSTYGLNNSALATLLCSEGIETLVFDIQDVGVRFYTFVWTMYDAMVASTLCDSVKTFMVLDRPNPAGGVVVQGPAVIDDGLSSFVGLKPIAVRHGMTFAELASLFAREFIKPRGGGVGFDGQSARRPLSSPPPVNFTSVLMDSWPGREGGAGSSSSIWIPPSPNIPTARSALVYVGFGLFEGVANLSVGRGTSKPFEYLGAPWVDYRLAEYLNPSPGASNELSGAAEGGSIPGVAFREAYFEPLSDVFAKQVCGGVQICVTGGIDNAPAAFDPMVTALRVMVALKRLYPAQFGFRKVAGPGKYWIDMLLGSNYTRLAIDSGVAVDDIVARWRVSGSSGGGGLDDFVRMRSKYLKY